MCTNFVFYRAKSPHANICKCSVELTYLRYILENNLIIDMFVYFLQNRKCSVGTKPCLLFSGQVFENDAIYKRLKSILIGGLTHCHGDVMMQNCHRL